MSAYDISEDPGDPVIEDQKYVCISYAPHPDHNTIFFKVRGSYATVEEARERAIYLHQMQLAKQAEMAAQNISYPFISIYVGEVGQFLSAQSPMIDFSQSSDSAPDIPINIISECIDETIPSDDMCNFIDEINHTTDVASNSPSTVMHEDPIISMSEPTADINNTDSVDVSCLACRSTKRNALFLPCRHICFCINCSSMHIKKHRDCPICRTAIKEILNVFLN